MTTPSDATLGRLAIALDDLLRNPRLAEVAAALRAVTPIGLLDQLDAAAAQARDGLRAAADMLGSDLRWNHFGGHPAWVTLGVLDTLAAWTSGRGRTCLHDPRPDRPQPVFAAAWRPRLVTCSTCTHLWTLRADSAADRTCDGCGAVTDGPGSPGEGVYPTAVGAGPLTYSLGACAGCRWWLDGSGDSER